MISLVQSTTKLFMFLDEFPFFYRYFHRLLQRFNSKSTYAIRLKTKSEMTQSFCHFGFIRY